MRPMIGITILLAAFGVLPAQAEISLEFGVYTSDKPSTMVRMFRPILNVVQNRLAEKLGEPVKIQLQVAKDYDEGIDDLVSGKVDFARMGPASYVTSKQRNPGLQLLAMESAKGKSTFYGIICVPEQSKVQTVAELKGRTFAFGNKRSTIGRYLSQRLLVEKGIYASDLARYEYLGRHDKVGAAVGAGQFDAGALKEGTFKKLRKKGIPIRELTRFLNVTKPWIAASEMEPNIVSALTEVLLELKDPTALKAIKKQGFLPAEDSEYDFVRKAMKNNDLFFNKTTAE